MAIYANKFTVEIGDVSRIVFVDERAAVAKGIPMSSTTVTEIVMTRENIKALADLIQQLLATLR
jgi:hypothetical protein